MKVRLHLDPVESFIDNLFFRPRFLPSADVGFSQTKPKASNSSFLASLVLIKVRYPKSVAFSVERKLNQDQVGHSFSYFKMNLCILCILYRFTY